MYCIIMFLLYKATIGLLDMIEKIPPSILIINQISGNNKVFSYSLNKQDFLDLKLSSSQENGVGSMGCIHNILDCDVIISDRGQEPITQ